MRQRCEPRVHGRQRLREAYPLQLARLSGLFVDTDLSEPNTTFRELIKALESAYLASEPALWTRLTVYWRPVSHDLLEQGLGSELERVRLVRRPDFMYMG